MKIIFDTTTKAFPWMPIRNSVGLLVFACILILLKKVRWRYSLPNFWNYLAIVTALAVGAYYSINWYFSHQSRIRTLESGHYEVVQGRVKDFHPMPDDGSSDEWFTLAGHTFSYSDNDVLAPTPCFNQTAPHRGPIHDGLALQVKFVNQCILQIEELPENAALPED